MVSSVLKLCDTQLSRKPGVEPRPDPLARFRAKGEAVKQQLLKDQEQPALNSSEVAQLLGTTPDDVRRQRAQHKLVAVLAPGSRHYLFPRWQFQNDAVVIGLPEVLAALGDVDEWTVLNFLCSGDRRLDGDTPLERLKVGDLEAVLTAAQAYGYQNPA